MMRALKTRIKHVISPKYKYLRQFRLGKEAVVVDLGANVGEVCEYFLNKGANVYGYEPNPHAFGVLSRRVAGKKRAIIHKAAVSNFAGHAELWLHESHGEGEVEFSQGGSLQSDKENVGKDCIIVNVLDITDVLAAHAHINLLKIDIEGGEYEIMDAVLAAGDKIDYVVLETHQNKGRVFKDKHEALLKKIEKSPHKSKIFMDWF